MSYIQNTADPQLFEPPCSQEIIKCLDKRIVWIIEAVHLYAELHLNTLIEHTPILEIF